MQLELSQHFCRHFNWISRHFWQLLQDSKSSPPNFYSEFQVRATENSIQYWRRSSYDHRLDALKSDRLMMRDEAMDRKIISQENLSAFPSLSRAKIHGKCFSSHKIFSQQLADSLESSPTPARNHLNFRNDHKHCESVSTFAFLIKMFFHLVKIQYGGGSGSSYSTASPKSGKMPLRANSKQNAENFCRASHPLVCAIIKLYEWKSAKKWNSENLINSFGFIYAIITRIPRIGCEHKVRNVRNESRPLQLFDDKIGDKFEH